MTSLARCDDISEREKELESIQFRSRVNRTIWKVDILENLRLYFVDLLKKIGEKHQ